MNILADPDNDWATGYVMLGTVLFFTAYILVTTRYCYHKKFKDNKSFYYHQMLGWFSLMGIMLVPRYMYFNHLPEWLGELITVIPLYILSYRFISKVYEVIDVALRESGMSDVSWKFFYYMWLGRLKENRKPNVSYNKELDILTVRNPGKENSRVLKALKKLPVFPRTICIGDKHFGQLIGADQHVASSMMGLNHPSQPAVMLHYVSSNQYQEPRELFVHWQKQGYNIMLSGVSYSRWLVPVDENDIKINRYGLANSTSLTVALVMIFLALAYLKPPASCCEYLFHIKCAGLCLSLALIFIAISAACDKKIHSLKKQQTAPPA